MPGFDITKLFVNLINGKSGVVNFPILDASIYPGTGENAITYGQTNNTASGAYSMAGGRDNEVSGGGGVALGRGNTVSGPYALAAGYSNLASAAGAMALGVYNKATAQSSFAEGQGSQASGTPSHSEGYYTKATAMDAHAEGWKSEANGKHSHVEGILSKATHSSQHVFGDCNALDPSEADGTQRGTYVEIVGNGTDEDNRSNARTLDWDGNEVLAGKLTLGAGPTNNMDAATKKYVDDAKSWTQCSGSSTSSSQKITYPAEATELLIKAKSAHSANVAYFTVVPVVAIQDLEQIMVGGYWYSTNDYGIANVNHDAANRTIAFRNVRYSSNTSGTVTVYWR